MHKLVSKSPGEKQVQRAARRGAAGDVPPEKKAEASRQAPLIADGAPAGPAARRNVRWSRR